MLMLRCWPDGDIKGAIVAVEDCSVVRGLTTSEAVVVDNVRGRPGGDELYVMPEIDGS
jgi:hypothetical protein